MGASDRKLTYEDYVHFPEGQRWELIDGEAYVVPSPNARHQDIAGLLYRRVAEHLETHGGGRVFIAPFDVVLDPGDVLQPDVVFIADEDLGALTDANVWGKPTWVVEVLSPSTRGRDQILKLRRYERFGVSECWLVDPVANVVHVYRLGDDTYESPLEARPAELIGPLRPAELEIDLTELFAERS
jgi:Uma2 family endonuclease